MNTLSSVLALTVLSLLVATANADIVTTDTSGCQGPAPANASIFGTWHGDSVSNGDTLRDVVSFSQNEMELTLICRNPYGNSASSTVTSNIVLTNSTLQTLGAPSHTEKSSVNNDDHGISCTTSLPAVTAQYEFVGGCLKITFGAQSRFYIR